MDIPIRWSAELYQLSQAWNRWAMRSVLTMYNYAIIPNRLHRSTDKHNADLEPGR